jgi:hypothetical protein
MSILSKEIMTEWGVAGLPPEEQNDALLRVGNILYQAILVKSLDILSEQDEEELDALLDLDTTTTKDVLSFLKSKIPTFAELVKEESKNLKANLSVSQ